MEARRYGSQYAHKGKEMICHSHVKLLLISSLCIGDLQAMVAKQIEKMRLTTSIERNKSQTQQHEQKQQSARMVGLLLNNQSEAKIIIGLLSNEGRNLLTQLLAQGRKNDYTAACNYFEDIKQEYDFYQKKLVAEDDKKSLRNLIVEVRLFLAFTHCTQGKLLAAELELKELASFCVEEGDQERIKNANTQLKATIVAYLLDKVFYIQQAVSGLMKTFVTLCENNKLPVTFKSILRTHSSHSITTSESSSLSTTQESKSELL